MIDNIFLNHDKTQNIYKLNNSRYTFYINYIILTLDLIYYIFN